MRIKVKSFSSIRKAMGDETVLELEVERENVTLKSLLDDLSSKYGENFVDVIFNPVTKKVKPENQILLNGHHYKFLPDRLNTKLKDGDVVALIPLLAGG